MNCLKFISLNIVSFLECAYLERLVQLPVYLVRELENFIKLEDSDKYVCVDMRMLEEAEYQQNNSQPRESLTQDGCGRVYTEIVELFEEYTWNGRLQEGVKVELCGKVHRFRQVLRKSHKKFRKGSSSCTG